jgi:hypothetical protein
MPPTPLAEFRRNAAECRRMADATSNSEIKDMWVRLAERWFWCADLAEHENFSAHRLAVTDARRN